MTDNPIPANPKHHVMHAETAHLGLKVAPVAVDVKDHLVGCECGNIIGRYDSMNDVIICEISMTLIKQFQGQKIEIVLVGERIEREDGASVVPIFIRRLDKC